MRTDGRKLRSGHRVVNRIVHLSGWQLLEHINKHDINGVRVVIDQSRARKRGHLHYALMEDPRIDFAVHSHDPTTMNSIQDGMQLRIDSNGVSWSAKRC